MADYTGNTMAIVSPSLSITPSAGMTMTGGDGSTPVATVDYYQRVYSTSAGWCYYTKSSIDPTPLSTETAPNHADDLVAGAHSILWEM